jgi:transcriptional regulator with XRE-family HTH domain
LENFAERLRRLRTAQLLSTSDLAYRVGVTEGAIRQIESGRTKSANFTLGLKLAETLDVDPWYLATGVGRKIEADRDQSGSLKDRMSRLEARLERVERDVAGSRAPRKRVAAAGR